MVQPYHLVKILYLKNNEVMIKFKNLVRSRDVTQWQRACLACMKPGVNPQHHTRTTLVKYYMGTLIWK